MPERSPLKVQGVSTQRGAAADRRRPGQTPRLRGAWHLRLCPPRGAGLWAWLALTALLAPGAWSFLNEEQEELLVELHNHYRGQVSPSAAAMLPLKWDAALKLVAETYASKCHWTHNPDLVDIGENLYVTQGPLDLREAMEKWFLEHLDFDYSNNSCDEEKMCGHYTQMVWADTHRVGCAFHLCNRISGLDWERASFLVCNYYPPGNYEDERPYVEGDFCSRCPENLQNCENNLCVDDTMDEVEDEEEPEEETVFPPPATPPPSFPPAEDEEEALAPGSTAPPSVQPVTTTTSFHTPLPTTPPPVTPPQATPPEFTITPRDPGEREKNTEEVEVTKDRGRKRDATKESVHRDIIVSLYPKVAARSGCVWLPPPLLVCLAAFLTLHV